MAKRYVVKNHYVIRRKDGTFKKWENIGKSIRIDKRIKAKYHPKKKGYGYKGDYSKRRRKTSKRRSKRKKR